MQNNIKLVLSNNYFKLRVSIVPNVNNKKDSEEMENAISKINESLSVIKETLSSMLSVATDQKIISNSVSEYIDNKISAMQSLSFLNKGKPYSENAIHSWIKFKKIWDSFTQSTFNKNLSFSDVEISTYYEFLGYCDSLSFRKSTKCLYATIFKAVMSYAYTDEVSHNMLFANRNFITHFCNEEDSHTYLTNAEIEKLAELNLVKESTYDKVRDVFLIGCYTGQRFSDYSVLKISDIIEMEVDGKKYKVIKKKQKKTGKEVLLPILNDNIIALLDKWGGILPKVAISTMNSKIKKVCKLAGIIDTVKKYETIGGIEKEIILSKDLLISSHTARRSCITNLYLEGKLDLIQIRSISGHKTEQSFYRYLCYSSEECAKKIIQSLR